ncbi:MAG: peptide chain release factor 1 [Clostridia bacterium]|nr:peptide chain release factor 1 [Clostridia bacterium]
MKISDSLISKLDKITARHEEINALLATSEVICDQERFRALSKEHSDLYPIVEKYELYLKHKRDFEDCGEMLAIETDGEVKALAKQEMDDLRDAMDSDIEEIKLAMLPKDPNENNNVIMEIRAGAGGDEAALFGTELMKMYRHYADANRWTVDEVNMNYTELGGAKELVFMISGKGVYGKLKYESGVHRVQRVPETESQGRVHTSTVTVAVLPEAQDVEVNLNENDIKVDTYRSGGAGGQHVNKTESAIRMTHLPTGIVVECQDERSQIKNREKAMKVLKSRVYDFYQSQAQKEYAENRRAQVGTGDRSERIRTYNFPQGRVTDHRIGFTLYSLDKFMLGEMDEMVEALRIAVQNKMLENIE